MQYLHWTFIHYNASLGIMLSVTDSVLFTLGLHYTRNIIHNNDSFDIMLSVTEASLIC